MNEIKTSRRQFLAIGVTAVAAAAIIPRVAQAQGALRVLHEAGVHYAPGKAVNAKGWCAAYAAKV